MDQFCGGSAEGRRDWSSVGQNNRRDDLDKTKTLAARAGKLVDAEEAGNVVWRLPTAPRCGIIEDATEQNGRIEVGMPESVQKLKKLVRECVWKCNEGLLYQIKVLVVQRR